MNKKFILMEALNNREPERIPWLPYVGVHSGYLIGETAEDLLKSADLMYKGFKKAREEYNPDGLPIAFDLHLEAEALGCGLLWSDENPPAVIDHILDRCTLSELKMITEKDGRISLILEATEEIMKEYGEDIGVLGLMCGPFTLGLHLLGSTMITAMIKNPERVLEVLEFCDEVCQEMIKMYLKRGVEIIAIVDPMTSQISPQFFDRFAAPYYQKSIDLIREAGGYSLIFVCGNATRVIPNLAKINADGFGVDENLDFAYVAEEARKEKRVFAGNLPLTVGILFGEVEDNIAFAEKCIEEGKSPGFILAPGCDIPYSSSPENIKAVTNVVHKND